MEVTKPSAIGQWISSERVVGALLLVAVVAFTLLFPTIFEAHQADLMTILAALVAQFVGLHTYVKISAGEIVLNEDKGRPLFEPLRKLWRSRKFMATLVGMVLELLVIYLHLPEAMRAQLLTTILMLVTLYNGAVAVEDVQANKFFRRNESTVRAL